MMRMLIMIDVNGYNDDDDHENHTMLLVLLVIMIHDFAIIIAKARKDA